jgi:hypothetical protein
MLNRKRQDAFRAAYEACGSITTAAKAAKITREAHYFWLRTDPAYAAAFRESQMIAADTLQDEAVRRATEGWTEDVYYQGVKCGEVRRYSDGLLQFLLGRMLPEKYGRGDRKPEIAAPAVQPKVEVVYVNPDPPVGHDITPISVPPAAAIASPKLPKIEIVAPPSTSRYVGTVWT